MRNHVHPASAAPARTTAPTPAPSSPRSATAGPSASRGDPDHPITRGWLCAKVRPYLDRVYHPDRLHVPAAPRRGRRAAASGSASPGTRRSPRSPSAGRRSSPSTARAAILPYSYSGTLGLVQLGVASARLWNRMGASGLERSICGAAAETAVKLHPRRAPGARLRATSATASSSSSGATTRPAPSPHFMPFLREAQRDGAYVVVIDPRRTADRPLGRRAPPPAPGHRRRAGPRADARPLRRRAARRSLAARSTPSAGRSCASARRPTRRSASPRSPASRPSRSSPWPAATARPSRPCSSSPTASSATATAARPCRALACLPAVVGQYGVRGGGLSYSDQRLRRAGTARRSATARECPPTPRDRQHEPPRRGPDRRGDRPADQERSTSSPPTRSPPAPTPAASSRGCCATTSSPSSTSSS